MIEFVLVASSVGFLVLVLWAAASDIASMTIPNRIPAGLCLLFAVAAVAAPLDLAGAGMHVAVAFAVFAGTVALFAAGLFGGGDAKLMPAIALWMGPSATVDFVFHTAVAGGLLGLAFILLRRVPLPAAAAAQPWIARLMTPNGGIPYGIAIAWGAAVAAGSSPLLAASLR